MAVMIVDRSAYLYLDTHDLAHDASHVVLLTAGLLYWEPLLGGSTRRRLSHPVRIVAVLANMPFEVMIGIWLRYQSRPIDRLHTLADTHTGGEAFIVAATLASTIWLLVMIGGWAAAALREERREEHSAGRKSASTDAQGGWTVPWWVQRDDLTGSPLPRPDSVTPASGADRVTPA
jgi:cytochrome c oxidase assembly factor CtaG